MTPQGYELWLAQIVNESDRDSIISGRVIDWYVPVNLGEENATNKIRPVVAFHEANDGQVWVEDARPPWFLGSSRDEALGFAHAWFEDPPVGHTESG
ncbi:hypothetical protein ACQEVC_12915 [Plantactinospora sp. CA-294935]|uniref:hypothetical protein n=1 Tax=Plantactinospora sp. CA-294935 TaxID=3240012 RepID=UPI003D8A15D9